MGWDDGGFERGRLGRWQIGEMMMMVVGGGFEIDVWLGWDLIARDDFRVVRVALWWWLGMDGRVKKEGSFVRRWRWRWRW